MPEPLQDTKTTQQPSSTTFSRPDFCLQNNCAENAYCTTTNTGFECECKDGFKGDGRFCERDFCFQNDCDQNAVCIENSAVSDYFCECRTGFFGNGTSCNPGSCFANHKCPENAKCVSANLDTCECMEGIERKPNGACINYCSINDCDENAICSETDQSYECNCKQGFYGNGKSCNPGNCFQDQTCPINEECTTSTGISCQCKVDFDRKTNGTCLSSCSKNNCVENEICNDTDFGFVCRCRDGFEKKSNGTCLPGCSENDCSENEVCKSTDSGFVCLCEDGFERKLNGICLPNCSRNECDKDAVCSETEDGYNCECRQRFYGDGKKCNPNNEVLVLNRISDSGDFRPAIVIDSVGDQEELSCFKRDSKTQARGSCSIIWQNQMIVFGGRNQKQQISRLDDFRLNRIGSLAFDHHYGACSVMNGQIYLCFGRLSKG